MSGHYCRWLAMWLVHLLDIHWCLGACCLLLFGQVLAQFSLVGSLSVSACHTSWDANPTGGVPAKPV